MPKRIIVRCLALLAAVVCMLAIFFFSSQDIWKSKDISGSLLQLVFQKFFSGLPAERFETANLIFRKCAHFCIYAGLSACAAVFLSTFRGKLWWKFGLTVLVSFIYAALDEWHQTFVSGRTGSFRDVMIDTCGALLGVAIVFFFVRRSIRKKMRTDGF